jgi:hypothetical protein
VREKEGKRGEPRTFARYSVGISVILKARAIHGTYSRQRAEQGEEGSNEGNIFISELFRVRMHDGVAKASLRCVSPSLLASLLPYLLVAMTSWIAT